MKLNDIHQIDELNFNKLQDMHKIEQIVDDIAMMYHKYEDDAMRILGLGTLGKEEVEHHLYQLDKVVVHRILRQLTELVAEK